MEPEPEPEPKPLARTRAMQTRATERASAKAAGASSISPAAPKKPGGAASGAAAGGLVPSGAFVRIKPLDAEPGGGTATAKRITGWDAAAGTIEMETGRGAKVFDYPTATLPPEATQEQVYATIAAPLVAQFCEGTDVDLLSYGQTGSGKTYTMFGPPHSMAEAAEVQRQSGAGRGVSGDGILRPEHGFVLRSGLETLAAMHALEVRGCRAALYGAMIEMSILSFQDQRCQDLLCRNMPICFIDDDNHLQGATQMELSARLLGLC
jgi:hypothetical protein